MIAITVTEQEKKQLIFFAEKALQGGHWGSGELEIPEERQVYEIILRSSGTVELTMRQVELFLNWFFEATQHGTYLLPEDMSILEKIVYKLYGHYNERKQACLRELDKIAEIIVKSADLFPGKKFDLPLDRLKKLEEIERNEAFEQLKKSIETG